MIPQRVCQTQKIQNLKFCQILSNLHSSNSVALAIIINHGFPKPYYSLLLVKGLQVCQMSKLEEKNKIWYFGFEATLNLVNLGSLMPGISNSSLLPNLTADRFAAPWSRIMYSIFLKSPEINHNLETASKEYCSTFKVYYLISK